MDLHAPVWISMDQDAPVCPDSDKDGLVHSGLDVTAQIQAGMDQARKDSLKEVEALPAIGKQDPEDDLAPVKESISDGKPDREKVVEWILSRREDLQANSYSALAATLNAAEIPTMTGRATQVDQASWETITPLDGLEVDSLDPDSLPGIIGEYALAVAQETETPLELPAGMIFAVIATCIQGRIKCQIKPGYSEPLSFWTVTPMDPGTRKSQVLKRVTKPLADWEQRQKNILKPSINKRRIERENTIALIKSMRTKYAKAKSIDRQEIEDEIIGEQEGMEPEIVAPQLWAQDSTPENTAMIMAKNQERIAVIAAEGGILDTLGGRYNNGVANLDLYLQAYFGDPVKVNRVNRDDIFLNDPALSMGLLPQPNVIKSLGAKAEFTGRGFMGRPLYFIPKSNLGFRTLETYPIPEQTKNDYTQTIEALLKIKPIEHDDGTTEPHILHLSKEAFQEWFDFARAIEKEMATGGAL